MVAKGAVHEPIHFYTDLRHRYFVVDHDYPYCDVMVDPISGFECLPTFGAPNLARFDRRFGADLSTCAQFVTTHWRFRLYATGCVCRFDFSTPVHHFLFGVKEGPCGEHEPSVNLTNLAEGCAICRGQYGHSFLTASK